VHPKCICNPGSTPNLVGEAYSAPPDHLADGKGARCNAAPPQEPFSHSRPLGLTTALQTNSGYAHGFCKQSKLLQSFVSKRRLKNTGLVDCMVGLITVWPLLLLTVLTYKGMHKLDRLSLSGCLVTYRDGLTQFIETNALLLSQTTT